MGCVLSVSSLAQTQPKAVSSLVKVDLPSPHWNEKTGRTEVLTFDVPVGAVSFGIFAYSSSLTDYYLIDSVIDPQGKIFVSPKPLSGSAPKNTGSGLGIGPFYSPNSSQFGARPGYTGLLVPNNPELSVRPGQWKIQVQAVDATGVHSKQAPKISVLIKKISNPITDKTKGQLKVYFNFTGSSGLTSKTAVKSKFFKDVVKKLTAIYALIGIDVQFQKFSDVSFPPKTAMANDPRMAALFKKGTGTDGINIFFVENISLGPGLNAQGLSGAIFGPMGLAKVSSGGVLVSSTPPNPLMRMPQTGTALAHEIAHFLGLPHTYDSTDGTNFYNKKTSRHDPFNDTEKEPNSDNLMTPGLDHDGDVLSAQQRYQIFLNPLIMVIN